MYIYTYIYVYIFLIHRFYLLIPTIQNTNKLIFTINLYCQTYILTFFVKTPASSFFVILSHYLFIYFKIRNVFFLFILFLIITFLIVKFYKQIY